MYYIVIVYINISIDLLYQSAILVYRPINV